MGFLNSEYLLLYILLLAALTLSQIQIENDRPEEDVSECTPNITVDANCAPTCATEMNTARQNNGKSQLTYNCKIAAAAKYHNDYMVSKSCFSHKCDDNEPALGDRVGGTCYDWQQCGEIIAKGYSNCTGAINGWLDSPSHKDIMLSEDYTVFGCSTKQNYYTCDFACPFN